MSGWPIRSEVKLEKKRAWERTYMQGVRDRAKLAAPALKALDEIRRIVSDPNLSAEDAKHTISAVLAQAPAAPGKV